MAFGQSTKGWDVSTQVYYQKGPTCWSYTAATVIRAAQERAGIQKETHSSLRKEMYRFFGDKEGQHVSDVFDKLLPSRKLTYKRIYGVDEVKIAIQRHGAVAATMFMSENQWAPFRQFFKNNPNGVLKHLPKANDEQDNHAVVLVGFHETGNYWKFKNSWSNTFGDSGYFRMDINLIRIYYLVVTPIKQRRALQYDISYCGRCGKQMEVCSAIKCYGKAVGCDICGTKYGGTDKVYHCFNGCQFDKCIGGCKRTCPGKHGLWKFRTDVAGYGCNSCGKKWEKGTILYGCRTCNYDLCSDCRSRK